MSDSTVILSESQPRARCSSQRLDEGLGHVLRLPSLTVTGTARGIGLELVKLYASSPNNIVIAGVRDVKNATSIQNLIDGSEYKAKIHLVKLDAGDVEGNKAAAKEIESAFGKVDILWANAGECKTNMPHERRK